MTTSIYQKLSALQKQRVTVVPTKTATGRAGRMYRYAGLDDILAVALPALNAAGLVMTQTVECDPDTYDRLVTTIADAETGESIRSVMSLPCRGDDTWHGYGSSLTYARRYSIAAALNIASDDDDDGHGSLPDERQERQAGPSQARAQAPARGNGESVPPCPDCGNIGMKSKYPSKDGTVFYCGKCKLGY